MDTRPIGIFDSGVGGLTVVKQIMKVMPHENIVYFGDTARVPYGTKSKEAVTKYSKQNVRFLLSKEVKAIIVACNTASSNSLDALRETFDVPIFGVFVPLAEEGWTDNEVSRQAAKRYLEELVATGIDSLVLGCTHYPLLKRCIGQTVGEAIKLVDPAKATARRVMAFLKEHDLLNEGEGAGEKQFYLSDSTDTFRFVCQKALKHPYEPEIIDIEMY